jgi:hypothetical protein
MPDQLAPFLFLLFIGVVVALGIHAYRQNQARLAALSGLAASLGWRFLGDAKDRNFDERHPQFSRFRRGDDRYAHNRLRGTIPAFDADLAAEAGDYHYTETSGSGKNRSTTTYHFSYLVVTLPFGAFLPDLAVRRENLLDKLAGAIGFEDIDFESAEFSRRYHVSSRDRRFTHSLIDPRMIEFLLIGQPRAFELGKGVLLLTSGSTRWDAVEVDAAIRWTREFLARWPGHLVTDLRPR